MRTLFLVPAVSVITGFDCNKLHYICTIHLFVCTPPPRRKDGKFFQSYIVKKGSDLFLFKEAAKIWNPVQPSMLPSFQTTNVTLILFRTGDPSFQVASYFKIQNLLKKRPLLIFYLSPVVIATLRCCNGFWDATSAHSCGLFYVFSLIKLRQIFNIPNGERKV